MPYTITTLDHFNVTIRRCASLAVLDTQDGRLITDDAELVAVAEALGFDLDPLKHTSYPLYVCTFNGETRVKLPKTPVFTHLLCPACGSDRIGTAEDIVATALITGLNADGTFAYTGETVIHYDSSTTQKDMSGVPILACCACAYECSHGSRIRKPKGG